MVINTSNGKIGLGGDNMKNWKRDVSTFIVDHRKNVEEITQALSSIMEELKEYFEGSESLKGISVKGQKPDDEANPVWILYVGGFSVELDLERIRNERTKQNAEGFTVFDSEVKVEDAIKKIISREFKSKSFTVKY